MGPIFLGQSADEQEDGSDQEEPENGLEDNAKDDNDDTNEPESGEMMIVVPLISLMKAKKMPPKGSPSETSTTTPSETLGVGIPGLPLAANPSVPGLTADSLHSFSSLSGLKQNVGELMTVTNLVPNSSSLIQFRFSIVSSQVRCSR
jgi:hypothetical protein